MFLNQPVRDKWNISAKKKTNYHNLPNKRPVNFLSIYIQHHDKSFSINNTGVRPIKDLLSFATLQVKQYEVNYAM